MNRLRASKRPRAGGARLVQPAWNATLDRGPAAPGPHAAGGGFGVRGTSTRGGGRVGFGRCRLGRFTLRIIRWIPPPSACGGARSGRAPSRAPAPRRGGRTGAATSRARLITIASPRAHPPRGNTRAGDRSRQSRCAQWGAQRRGVGRPHLGRNPARHAASPFGQPVEEALAQPTLRLADDADVGADALRRARSSRPRSRKGRRRRTGSGRRSRWPSSQRNAARPGMGSASRAPTQSVSLAHRQRPAPASGTPSARGSRSAVVKATLSRT